MDTLSPDLPLHDRPRANRSDESLFLRQTQRRMAQWWLRLACWLLPLYLALGAYRELLFMMNPGVVLHQYQQSALYDVLQSTYGIVSALTYLLPLLVWLLAVRQAEKVSVNMLEECAAPRLRFGQAWRFRLFALQGLPVICSLFLVEMINAYGALLGASQSGSWIPAHVDPSQAAMILGMHSGVLRSEFTLGLLFCWVAAMLPAGKQLWYAALALRAMIFLFTLLPRRGQESWNPPQWPFIGGCLLATALVALALHAIYRGRSRLGLGLLVYLQISGLLSLLAWRVLSAATALPDVLRSGIVMLFSLEGWIGFLTPVYRPHFDWSTRNWEGEPSVFISPFMENGLELGPWAIFPVLAGQLLGVYLFYRLLLWLAGRTTRSSTAQASQLAADNETVLE